MLPAGAVIVTFVGRPFPLEEAPQHLARHLTWGQKGCAGQLRHTDPFHRGGCIPLHRREARAHWGVRCLDGYEWPRCVQERRLEVVAAHDDHRPGTG